MSKQPSPFSHAPRGGYAGSPATLPHRYPPREKDACYQRPIHGQERIAGVV